MNHLKKIMLVFALVFMLVKPSVYANRNVGDVIGHILNTDIVTYINDIEVRSYNIEGRTAIIAQDLACTDFSVTFDEERRILNIKNGGGSDYFLPEIKKIDMPVGAIIGNVYYTDIVTYYENIKIQSFNIGGLTCIFSDEFSRISGASYVFNDAERTVRITTKDYIPLLSKVSAVRRLDAKNLYAEKEFSLRRWGKAKNSHITVNEDGGYTVVEIGEHVNIEKYDSYFKLTDAFAIKRELPIFGALYFGKEYNYIAFGQENFTEDNSREIIKIVIYDKNFVKISEVPVYNCKTTVPFDAGCAELSENEKYLVLHASRSQYAEENGSRPQTQLTVIIDKADWSIRNMLGKFQPNHTSHSLRQHVRVEDEEIATLDLCDTAPYRGVVLSVLDSFGNPKSVQSIFNAGGPLGANCTGIMTGGFEATGTGYLAAINTIDHSLAKTYDSVSINGTEKETRDIYLLWTNAQTGEIKHNCLARYTGLTTSGSVPYLVKLDNSLYAVLWQDYDDLQRGIVKETTVNCVLADENGNPLTKAVKIRKALLSDSCVPIKAGNALVWYVNTDSGRDFYSIDLSAVKGNIPGNSSAENEPEIPTDNTDAEEKPEAEENVNEKEKPEKEITEVDGI